MASPGPGCPTVSNSEGFPSRTLLPIFNLRNLTA